MAFRSKCRSASGRQSLSRASIVVGGGVVFAGIAFAVGLTPGISVGVLSNPVAPLIVPPSITQVAAVNAVSATTVTPTTTAPATSIPGRNVAPATSAVVTTTATATSTVPASTKSGPVLIAVGPALQRRPVTIQATGFRPNEVVTFTISRRKITVKADALGRAKISHTVAPTASSLRVNAAAKSGSRLVTVPVRAR
jgi:hypothetical protein